MVSSFSEKELLSKVATKSKLSHIYLGRWDTIILQSMVPLMHIVVHRPWQIILLFLSETIICYWLRVWHKNTKAICQPRPIRRAYHHIIYQQKPYPPIFALSILFRYLVLRFSHDSPPYVFPYAELARLCNIVVPRISQCCLSSSVESFPQGGRHEYKYKYKYTHCMWCTQTCKKCVKKGKLDHLVLFNLTPCHPFSYSHFQILSHWNCLMPNNGMDRRLLILFYISTAQRCS